MRPFLAAFVAALSLLTSVAAPAATLLVKTAVDTDAADGFCSLREAITAANTDMPRQECPAGSGADRILFDLPERFGFTTELQVYISHVNYGGHLDNAQLLSLVSEARMRFFQSLGYTEGDVAGLAIVVGDMLAQYKSEAFHGETLRVQMTPRDFNRYGCDLVFCMTEVSSGREVARGKTGVVLIDRVARKPAPIPDVVRKALEAVATR